MHFPLIRSLSNNFLLLPPTLLNWLHKQKRRVDRSQDHANQSQNWMKSFESKSGLRSCDVQDTQSVC